MRSWKHRLVRERGESWELRQRYQPRRLDCKKIKEDEARKMLELKLTREALGISLQESWQLEQLWPLN